MVLYNMSVAGVRVVEFSPYSVLSQPGLAGCLLFFFSFSVCS